MYNESSKNATAKYIKEKRDQLNLNMPKGKKEIYRKFAKTKGMSLNSYILNLIENDMKRE